MRVLVGREKLGNERGVLSDSPVFMWNTPESIPCTGILELFGRQEKTTHFCNSPPFVICLRTLSHLLLLQVCVVATPAISVF